MRSTVSDNKELAWDEARVIFVGLKVFEKKYTLDYGFGYVTKKQTRSS